MMSADAAGNPQGTMLFDSDGAINDDDYLNDFSMDIGDVFAILDEDPQQPNLNVTAEGFQHGELAPSQFDHEQKSQAESTTGLTEFRERDYFQWSLEDAGSQRSMGFDIHNESERDLNGVNVKGGLHALSRFDQNSFFPVPQQNSSYVLRSLSPYSDYPRTAFGGSSGSSLTFNSDQRQLQTNMQERSVQGEGLRGEGYVSFPVAAGNGFYFTSEDKVNGHYDHGISSPTEYGDSKLNENLISSISQLQNGEQGSSHFLSMENYNFNGEIQNSSSAFPDSRVEDGNMYSSSVRSYRNSDTAVPDSVQPEADIFEASNATCDGSNSCLTLPRDSVSDPEIGLSQTVTVQYQHDNSDKLNIRENHLLPPHSHGTFEEKLNRKEESPDSSLQDVSISDLDAPLSDDFCPEYHSDDTSLMSESSTDSSPIPSNKNLTFYSVDRGVSNASKNLVSDSATTWQSRPKSTFKNEQGDHLLQPHMQDDVLKDSFSSVQKNPSKSTIIVEDDTDICILDDISDPVCPPRPLVPFRAKPHAVPQRPEFSDIHYHGMGAMGFRSDERLTFRLALQDLSQPKSEASPPDGVLAVPLLRHQRIALSWMVQKETASLHCSGGILADDQGLGKTVSTIALILKERSPSTTSTVVKKENEFEALNLDDDDDDAELSLVKRPCSSVPMVTGKMVKKENSIMVVKGRPAAGTLVVCPTSVLRQWADELKTKVTSKANLSFLVYHGSNRTKDPNELAKYDVVLTTYAIVSMEVPKQPLVDKDDEEKGKQDTFGVSSGLLDSKKRKDPPTSNAKNRKGRSTVDGALLESTARPLGRVGWFRVILDEAQSIKNYRTQVARACWGLRAKRRWCLSGTPIQNAVDDLYSYFRFLRYDPYGVYKSFCSTIKMPISRNPTNGYKKLQAVLKTIMLRRTKGTVLDGKPIISLPSKTVSLKKVDFSMEERSFYSMLEAESREQFREYEDAGTVKQNYVNILLMLLRLRQACDHPLLVKGCDSNSSQKSSMEMAKKLPKDKKIELLSCLEITLAICTICNDPPEDAVVTICGHVFCNQCICEHLTTDENICPSPNCKVQLRAASVFSKGTLKSSLSDELDYDTCSYSSCFEIGDKQNKFEDSWSTYSSKIKAALEILQSLPRSQLSSGTNIEKPDDESSNSSVNAANFVSARSSPDSSVGIKNLQRYSNREVSEKAIIFSQWTRMLDLLEGPLKDSCIQYRRLDGTMSVAAREKAIKDFITLPEFGARLLS
ncbi:helicase-like transcription factor CHR28 isoform X2 [Asparagus officinalis]|uniref:helicase-like transcription factor CHR28 isoform X2 n=1 Tax=Asparagus officinalis TaxID=4686 RepID=UPI00098E3EC8|nr:helicase-like transcription factor CHR28 isoform X2 [Asparagus officinalis]